MNNIFLPSKNPASKLIAFLAIIASPLIVADQAKAQIVTNASDNAGNYSGGWTNGANGGFGFAAWQLPGAAGSTNGFNGSLIGTVPAPNYAPMATAGNAFAVYAGGDPGAFQDAVRSFSSPMAVGQTLTHSFAITFDNGNKGFALFNGSTEVFFFNVNNTGYSWSGGGSNAPTPWDTRSNGVVINFSATRTSSGFDYGISSAQDATLTKTGSITAAGLTALKYYISGAGGGDLGNLYFNNLQIAGPAPTTITNQVTFSVNMSYQASQGLFTSNSDTVQLRSSFDNWSTNNQLTNQGNNIFSGTFNVTGNQGSAVEYIFWNSSPLATNFGYETTGNRSLTLGAAGASTNLPTVFFSNLAGQRFVTFSVNMAIQQGKGAFNPLVNTNVQVRGDFNGWAGNQLTNQGGSVYSGSFLLSSSATNSNLGYKFYYASGTNDVWEGGGNRSFDLVFNSDGSNAPALSLGTNFFNNELFYATPTSLLGFATTQGAPSTNQSFTLVGLGLSNNISVTAPTDFELSADGGANYSGILSLVPSNGAYSNSVLARIAAGAAQGSISNNIQLASPGSVSASVLVTGNVAPAANGYSNWLTNYPSLGVNTNGTSDPDFDGFNNNLEFTFDGDPTVATAALMTVVRVGTNAVFNWIQRNTGVAYEVQKNSSLTNAWTPAVGLSISNSANQSGVLLSNDYTRQEFIITNPTGKDFYRVRGTITNN